MTVNTIITVWRTCNVGLAVVGLALLLDDVRRRRSLRLRPRFYWQAVALLLITTGWGSAEAIWDPPAEFNPVRIVIVTLALVYFLISIVQVRRFNRREEAQVHGMES